MWGGLRVLVFDTSNVLQDIPSDIFDLTAADVVNGGNAECTASFDRRWNIIGAIAEGYRFQVYLPDDLVTPWYDGRVVDIDKLSMSASGKVVATCEGWHTHLDDALTDFTINPGVQPSGQNNGQVDYGDLINWLINGDGVSFHGYKPTDITFTNIAQAGVNVGAIQAKHVGLASVLDTITKSILDNSGRHWEWTVRGTGPANGLTKVLAVNPVAFNAATALYAVFPGDLYDYDLRDSFAAIKNMLVLYGGTDPVTQEQVWGPFQDSVSIAARGAKQTAYQNQYLVSQAQLQQFATAFLALNAYPTFTGKFSLTKPTSAAKAGAWFNISEPAGVIKQVRISRVQISAKKTKFEQACEINAPIPGIDKALFDSGNNAGAVAKQMLLNPTPAVFGVNAVVQYGGDLLGTS